MRDRTKQRVMRKEERLESKNIWGINDKTPQEAVDRIIGESYARETSYKEAKRTHLKVGIATA